MTRKQVFYGVGGGVLCVVAVLGVIASNQDIPDIHVEAEDMYANRAALFNPHTLGQTFRATENNLNSIGVPISAYSAHAPTGRIQLHLRTSPSATEDIRAVTIPADILRSDTEVRFRFAPLPTSRGEQYYFFLTYPDGGADKAAAVRIHPAADTEHEAYGDGAAYVDGTATENDLSFTVYHRERPLTAWQLYGGVFLLGLALLCSLSRNTKERSPFHVPAARRVLLFGIPLLGILPFFRDLVAIGREGWSPLSATPFSLEDILLLSSIRGHTISILLAKGLSMLFLCGGFWGMVHFLRHEGRSFTAAFFGAGIFSFSSFFLLHAAAGHSALVGLALMPWILFLLLYPPKQHAFAFTSIGIALLCFFAPSGLLLAVLSMAVLWALSPERRASTSQSTLLAALCGVCLGSIPLLLALGAQWNEPFPPLGSTQSVWDILLDPNQRAFVDKVGVQPLPWIEYGAYVGIFPFFLALLGICTSPRKLFLPTLWAVVGLCFDMFPLLQKGYGIVGAHHLFGIPQHWIFFTVVGSAISAAHGLDALRRLLLPVVPLIGDKRGERARSLAFIFLVIVGIGNMFFVGAPILTTWFTKSPKLFSLHREPYPLSLLGVGIVFMSIGTFFFVFYHKKRHFFHE